MGVTSNFSFPYPGPTDAPNGADQLQSLAEAVDDALNTVQSDIQDDLDEIKTVYKSNQSAGASYTNDSTWNDFSAAKWPPISFVVPQSGQIAVTINGTLRPGTASIRFGWRISGTDTLAFDNSRSLYAQGAGVGASHRHISGGLTPGATNTLTPGWFTTDHTQASDDGNGEVSIEAL